VGYGVIQTLIAIFKIRLSLSIEQLDVRPMEETLLEHSWLSIIPIGSITVIPLECGYQFYIKL